jgi:hypothetical protein
MASGLQIQGQPSSRVVIQTFFNRLRLKARPFKNILAGQVLWAQVQYDTQVHGDCEDSSHHSGQRKIPWEEGR